MSLKNQLAWVISLSTLLISVSLSADLKSDLDQMCTKVKTCSIAEIEKENLPPEMRAMMEQTFNGMCQSMAQPYASTINNADLQAQASACIQSFLTLSCDQLMNSDGNFESAECKEFEKASEAYNKN